jgi:hypothetical protein
MLVSTIGFIASSTGSPLFKYSNLFYFLRKVGIGFFYCTLPYLATIRLMPTPKDLILFDF